MTGAALSVATGWNVSGAISSGVTPFVVLAAFVALYALRRYGVAVPYAPSARGLAFLAVTMALGPGLIVNLGLKDHTHRPRPVHVAEFGGRTNFVRGIASTGPAGSTARSFPARPPKASGWSLRRLSLPPPARAPAMAVAVAFGFGASLLRIAFGGHFLSDALLGGLIALIVIVLARRVIWPRGGP